MPLVVRPHLRHIATVTGGTRSKIEDENNHPLFEHSRGLTRRNGFQHRFKVPSRPLTCASSSRERPRTTCNGSSMRSYPVCKRLRSNSAHRSQATCLPIKRIAQATATPLPPSQTTPTLKTLSGVLTSSTGRGKQWSRPPRLLNAPVRTVLSLRFLARPVTPCSLIRSPGVWQWGMFPTEFVEKWHKEEEDRMNGRAPPPPLPVARDPPRPRSPRPVSPSLSRSSALPAAAEDRLPPPTMPRHSPAAPPVSANPVSKVKLPQHLRVQLHELFVDNLPGQVTIAECRDFFDTLGSYSNLFLYLS